MIKEGNLRRAPNSLQKACTFPSSSLAETSTTSPRRRAANTCSQRRKSRRRSHSVLEKCLERVHAWRGVHAEDVRRGRIYRSWWPGCGYLYLYQRNLIAGRTVLYTRTRVGIPRNVRTHTAIHSLFVIQYILSSITHNIEFYCPSHSSPPPYFASVMLSMRFPSPATSARPKRKYPEAK